MTIPNDATEPTDDRERSVDAAAEGSAPTREPIADVGTPVYEGEPAYGVADAYEGASTYDAPGAYEPDGAYTPGVTPVSAESIAPAGSTPAGDGTEPARVDPIGVYVPEDVPAVALPGTRIAEAESAAADVSAESSVPLPESAVDDAGQPTMTDGAASGPSAVRFDE